jgi:uncharacterized membrane protein
MSTCQSLICRNGAVIPTLLSLYILVKNRLYLLDTIGVAIVALVCYAVARPVFGLGIAEPVFVPLLAGVLAERSESM